ncbi:MAG TPA: histidine kinase [Leptolyngbya sp.]|jgi:two-component system clock-associated histidine kinase SasA|nr:histidine kinase [Leptolyngbya sp.]
MTMQAHPNPTPDSKVPLQILLFVDQRPTSRQQIRQIQDFLRDRSAEYPFELEVIDVGEQPYLAEHFRLMATPTLIKIHPEPRQTLTGSDLIVQLRGWWSRWQRSIEDAEADLLQPLESPSAPSIGYSAELLKLTDEVFRLQRETENLQAQLQFKDQIISMLAHDLRNPLTAASIAIETLEIAHKQADGQPSRLTPQMTSNLLRHGRTQIRTIDRMITDILQAARGTSAELHIQPEKLDLGGLCQEVMLSLRDRIGSKHQKIEVDIPSDLPIVYADTERVRQVITNILDNAIKYTPDSGTIHLSILHRTTQKVQITICDNGPGVPTENRDRIFEDHYRLQRDEAQDGYGIGLSLCQRIVRAHYGQIWVDSVANQGSCFHFTLPVFRS